MEKPKNDRKRSQSYCDGITKRLLEKYKPSIALKFVYSQRLKTKETSIA